MHKILLNLLIVFLAAATSCKNEVRTAPFETIEEPADSLAKVPDSWITERVSTAKEKLTATPAGSIVWNAMEAHGGLERWYANGPISFQFDYEPLDGSTRRNTTQTVDQWSNRARHQSIDDPSQEFGWNGKQAWTTAKDTTTFAFDTKFWSLTPYYFLAQPFVLDGTGVNLAQLDNKTFKDKDYDVIKITFEKGTGDAPDDYYILYFGKKDHKLGVIRYIVSYPEYFKDGGHAPEKFMELTGTTLVDGITLATGYNTHWLSDDETLGEHITTIRVDDISFKPLTEAKYFDRPEGANAVRVH